MISQIYMSESALDWLDHACHCSGWWLEIRFLKRSETWNLGFWIFWEDKSEKKRTKKSPPPKKKEKKKKEKWTKNSYCASVVLPVQIFAHFCIPGFDAGIWGSPWTLSFPVFRFLTLWKWQTCLTDQRQSLMMWSWHRLGSPTCYISTLHWYH